MGKLVASALQYPFLDADTLIEGAAKSSVAEIFAQEGEDAFRDMESQVLQVGRSCPLQPNKTARPQQPRCCFDPFPLC